MRESSDRQAGDCFLVGIASSGPVLQWSRINGANVSECPLHTLNQRQTTLRAHNCMQSGWPSASILALTRSQTAVQCHKENSNRPSNWILMEMQLNMGLRAYGADLSFFDLLASRRRTTTEHTNKSNAGLIQSVKCTARKNGPFSSILLFKTRLAL